MSGVEGGGKLRTEFAAWVAGMNGVRSTRPARVLPETAALIPVKAQTPEGVGGYAMRAGRKIQPNPPPHDFSQFILLGQLSFEQIQDGLCGQFAIGFVRGEGAGF